MRKIIFCILGILIICNIDLALAQDNSGLTYGFDSLNDGKIITTVYMTGVAFSMDNTSWNIGGMRPNETFNEEFILQNDGGVNIDFILSDNDITSVDPWSALGNIDWTDTESYPSINQYFIEPRFANSDGSGGYEDYSALTGTGLTSDISGINYYNGLPAFVPSDNNGDRSKLRLDFIAPASVTDGTDIHNMVVTVAAELSGGIPYGEDFNLKTTSSDWSGRYGHTSVVFDGKIWVMGGTDGTYKNDVWYSSDGVTWTEATSNAGWNPRQNPTSLVFDDKIWILGGFDDNYKNDVWYSSDGINWTQATGSADWTSRELHTSVVYDSKMWVIGGQDVVSWNTNDVWYSSDGTNWTEATDNAGWSPRAYHKAVVLNDKMWVMGGLDDLEMKNDVWYSDDGITWTEATSSADWSARITHTSVVGGRKIYVIGGYSDAYENDIWSSTDGISWTEVNSGALWSARGAHTSVIFNNKLWVLGGFDGDYKNDVWSSP